MKTPETFAEYLRRVMTELDLSIKDVAERSSSAEKRVSMSFIHDLLTEQKAIDPRISTLIALSRGLDRPLAELTQYFTHPRPARRTNETDDTDNVIQFPVAEDDGPVN